MTRRWTADDDGQVQQLRRERYVESGMTAAAPGARVRTIAERIVKLARRRGTARTTSSGAERLGRLEPPN